MKNSKVHLQGIGEVNAIQAKDLKAGHTTMWNFGYKSDVLSVEFSKTGKTVIATLKSREYGSTLKRNMRANRLVAIV